MQPTDGTTTSITPAGAVSTEIFSGQAQGRGAFDGGKITEIKPIPFPHETGGSRRLGPLLYWAWATAHGDGRIGMHPHQGFEIMSYVLAGEVGHTDTAHNNRRVGAGGAQVMRTGSGVSHQEEMYGERTDFFQIWFEPNLKEALARPPEYADFEERVFPVSTPAKGVRVKAVIGNGGPVRIATPATVEDASLEAGARHVIALPANHALAMVVIAGAGELRTSSVEGKAVAKPDFAVVKSGGDAEVELVAGDGGMRVMAVRVPLAPGYPLYSER